MHFSAWTESHLICIRLFEADKRHLGELAEFPLTRGKQR